MENHIIPHVMQDTHAVQWIMPCGNQTVNLTESLTVLNQAGNDGFAAYFLAPMLRFLSLRYGFLHFLHRVALMSFLHPHLKHILIIRRAFCAMRFFSGSVTGIRLSLDSSLLF